MAQSHKLETKASLSNASKCQLNYRDDNSWAGDIHHASPYPAMIKDCKHGLFLHLGQISKAGVVYRGDDFDWLTAWHVGPATACGPTTCKVLTEVAQRGAFEGRWDDIEERLDRDGKESSESVFDDTYTASVTITFKDNAATLAGKICIAG